MAELLSDPDYVERMRVAEERRAVFARELSLAEQPIVADLRGVGLDLDSVWDLVNTSVPYPEALPVLLAHLERGGYPDRVMESLGRALAVKPAVFAWDRLLRLYLASPTPGEEKGLALALCAMATKDHVETLIDLIRDESRGDVRVLFVGPILRKGGERGLQVIESLREHPVVGKEATALLKRRGR
jgi:hypothetical protein